MLVAYSFIATLIGAGFASGQEILCYFASFGKAGAVGIATASVLFFVFIYSVLGVCSEYGLSSLDSFLSISHIPFVKQLIRVMLTVFSYAVFAAMLSAFGEILSDLGIPPRLGSLAVAAACAAILSLGSSRVFDINGLLGLVLTAAIITCCIYMLRYREYHTFSQLTPVAVSGSVYSGFNLLPTLPILTVMSRRISCRREAAAAALISSAATGTLLMLIYILLATYSGKIPLGELPMLTLAARQSRTFAAIYRVILIAAAATTLLSSGGSILEALPLRNTPAAAILLSVTGFLISCAGFSRLISSAYRICGCIGITICLYIIYLCMSYFKTKNNSVNNRN